VARLVWYRWLSRFLASSDNRLAWWLDLHRPAGLFQPFGETRPNRYPKLFDHLADALAGRPCLRLLSFGCSRGDEVFSLADRFPHATIRGIDIAATRIKASQRRWRLRGAPTQISFHHAASTADEPTAQYDAVCALAVFRHGRLMARPADCRPWLNFAAFDHAVQDLLRILKPGGLLAIRHANFRVSDSSIATQITPIWCPQPSPDDITSPIYGRDNRLIAEVIGDDGLYRKRDDQST